MERKKIEIDFPVPVEVDAQLAMEISVALTRFCKRWEERHKDRHMWPCTFGSKMIYCPRTAAEEELRGPEFDDYTYHIEMAVKEKI